MKLVNAMYKNARSNVNVGVYQVSVLSPLLFSIVLEAVYSEFSITSPPMVASLS